MTTESTTPQDVIATYKYIRLVMPFPAFLIAVATLLEAALVTHHFRESMSDSYNSPIRDLFVGGLVATAVCLVAFKGHDKFEDYALNVAGFNALFVALVPNNFADILSREPDAQVRNALVLNLQINLWAVLFASALFLYFDSRLFPWTAFEWRNRPRVARLALGLSVAAEAILILMILGIAIGGAGFGLPLFKYVHNISAILLIANLWLAVASYAWPEIRAKRKTEMGVAPPTAPPPASLQYRAYAIVMLVVMVILGILSAVMGGHVVIITEYAGLLFFIIFWVYATRDVWALLLPAPFVKDKAASADTG